MFMRLIVFLFAALCLVGVLAGDSIQKDLSILTSDVQRAASDLLLGVGSLQDDLWTFNEHLGQATQTLKQSSTIPDLEAASICTDFTSLGLVPLLYTLQSHGTTLCFPVSAIKLAFEYYGGEFIARLKDKFICQAAVELTREIVLILDDAVKLLCDH